LTPRARVGDGYLVGKEPALPGKETEMTKTNVAPRITVRTYDEDEAYALDAVLETLPGVELIAWLDEMAVWRQEGAEMFSWSLAA
jgi:hypothetical protein